MGGSTAGAWRWEGGGVWCRRREGGVWCRRREGWCVVSKVRSGVEGGRVVSKEGWVVCGVEGGEGWWETGACGCHVDSSEDGRV